MWGKCLFMHWKYHRARNKKLVAGASLLGVGYADLRKLN